MLIQSHRHTPADLELWKEYEEADRAHVTLPGFFERVARCREAIKQFHRREKPHYVAVSWGKDSVVLLHLFRAAHYSPKVIYVRQLDNENPDSLKVRDLFLERFPHTDYEEVAYSYRDAEPSWFKDDKPYRWYQILKELQRKYGCHVTGIRADESSKRKRRCCVFGMETIYSFAPMSWMRCADVFAYHQLFGLPVHPNYAMLGGGRWDRSRLRVTAIGNIEGTGIGRREWEREYYGDVLRRMEANNSR